MLRNYCCVPTQQILHVLHRGSLPCLEDLMLVTVEPNETFIHFEPIYFGCMLILSSPLHLGLQNGSRTLGFSNFFFVRLSFLPRLLHAQIILDSLILSFSTVKFSTTPWLIFTAVPFDHFIFSGKFGTVLMCD